MIKFSLLNLKIEMSRHRLRATLIIAWAFTIALAMFLVYLGIDSYMKAKDRLTDQVSTYAYLIAEHDSFGFLLADFILKDAIEDMSWDDFNGPIYPSAHKDKVRQKLLNHQGRVPSIASFTAIGVDGIRRVGIVNKDGTDLSNRPYFLGAKNGGNPYISNFEDGLASGKPGIHVARQYVSKEGKFGGVLVINLAADDFFIPFYSSISLGPNVTTLLRDKDRVLLRYPNINKNISTLADPTLPSIAANLSKGVVAGDDPVDGLKKVFAFERLQDTGLYAVVAMPISTALNGPLLNLLLAFISDIFLILGMLAIHGWLVKNIQLEKAFKKLEIAATENKALLHKMTTVVEEDRKAVATEIHDSLNATLIGIKLFAGNIATLAAKDGDTASKKSILDMSKQIIESTKDLYDTGRSIIKRLRPEVLDILGLEMAVAEMVNTYNKADPDCEFTFKCTGDVVLFAPEREIGIYRVVQEALSNVIKHAGATLVTVALTFTHKHLEIHVTDNGRGIRDGDNAGFGILGMRERVLSMQGQINIKALDRRGTDVEIHIPLFSPPPPQEIKSWAGSVLNQE